jgi:Ca2+-binding RTX toxin-like protein
MTLIDPTGKTIDPPFLAAQDVDPGSAETTSTTIPNDFGIYSADTQTALYDFPNAQPGQWTIVLKAGADVPATGTAVESFAAYGSALHASATVDQRFYAPGSPARIAMTFSSPPDSAVVRAYVLRADGGSDTVPLVAQGAGIYAASYTVPAVPGFARIVVKATGTFGGAPFERGALMMAQITTSAVSLNGGYSDQAEPAPGNPSRKQALRVDVGVNSTFSGQVGLAADLVDSVGNFVAHAVTAQTVTSGNATLSLRFSAEQIFAAHVNGPYTLTHVLLVDQRNAPIVAARVDNVHQTEAYDYRIFAAAPDVPTLRLEDPYAVAEGSTTTLDATAVDPEGDALTFAWDLDGDGTFETSGQAPTFAAGTIDGPALRPVRVRVSDSAGHSAEASTTVDITNVTPSFTLGDPVHLVVGDTLQRTQTFVDPGPDVWTATVDYGDETPPGSLAVTGRSLTLDHQYTSAGTFVVKVVVADDDGGRSEATLLVDVTGPSPACTLVGTASPAFVYVPPDITTASCGAIDLGTPDACGAGTVTVTNDAPAKLRPGTTTVTWTARDGAGHTVTATQRVTLLLGDDPACCPAGTNIVVGTSNNDVLNGTTGNDCILGRGGQDTINGLGGDDLVSAGDGDDVVSGGIGNDVLFGGSGQDRLTGDGGNPARLGR